VSDSSALIDTVPRSFVQLMTGKLRR